MRRSTPRIEDPQLRAAWDEIDRLITAPGWSNALGQKLVQLTMPGVPDIYQGTELWEDSLVDPDNRRPVDFANRVGLLASFRNGPPKIDETGAVKLWITQQALRLRQSTARVLQQLPAARRARTRR